MSLGSGSTVWGTGRPPSGPLRKATTLQSGHSAGASSAGRTYGYLAMAHWQAGERGQARRSYDLAVAAGLSSNPTNKSLRAEVESLLGIRPSPANK